jgi:hypothetical protein
MGITADSLRTGITTCIQTALGEDYVQLAYTIDVRKNKFKAGTKAYAILPGALKQVGGVTSFATFDQEYEVWLGETYFPARQDEGDARSAADTLFGRLEDVFRQLVVDKAGVSAIVMSVFELAAEPVEYFDSNLALLRARFTIKYRIALP